MASDAHFSSKVVKYGQTLCVLQIALYKLAIPDDILDHIARRIHYTDCVVLLQRHVRGGITRAHFRHRFAPDWPRLQAALTTVGGAEMVEMLENNASVRKEWQLEALSWIHMLEEPESCRILQTIAREVLMGEWG